MPSVRANYLGRLSKSHLNTTSVSATLSFSSMCVQQTQILNWQKRVCFSIWVLLDCSCCLTSFCSCCKNPAVHWVHNRDKASFVPLTVLFTESALWAGSVIESPCPSVCLWRSKTPISGCHGDLWLKNAFPILACDETSPFILLHNPPPTPSPSTG